MMNNSVINGPISQSLDRFSSSGGTLAREQPCSTDIQYT